MSKLNKNNFVAWYEALSDDSTCYYAYPLVTGDVIKCYLNIAVDYLATGKNLGLWSEDTETVIYSNIGSVTELNGSEGLQYYFEYTVIDLAPGVYRFVIDDGTPDIYSSRFYATANTEYTSIVKYRNSKNAFNTIYEDIPTFYNQFRIDIRTGLATFDENVKGYETYNGNFIQTKSDVQKLVEFNTRFLDQNAHDGFFSMLAHSEFYIDEVQYKKGTQSNYTIEWSEFDDNKIGNGTVNLIEVDYSNSIINC